MELSEKQNLEKPFGEGINGIDPKNIVMFKHSKYASSYSFGYWVSSYYSDTRAHVYRFVVVDAAGRVYEVEKDEIFFMKNNPIVTTLYDLEKSIKKEDRTGLLRPPFFE